MPENSVAEKYYSLLKKHLNHPHEKHLLSASELGRKLALANIPVEQIAECHEKTLARLNVEFRESRKSPPLGCSSAPLAKLLASYGRALQERVVAGGPMTAKLQESYRRLVRAQRVDRVGFLHWDLSTNEIFLSPELCRLYGLEQEKVIATPELLVELVHPEDREHVKKNLDAVMQGEKGFAIVHRIMRENGAVLWVHAQAELNRDSAGNPARLVGTLMDITEQKAAEEALRESEETLKKSQEIAHIGSWRYDVKHDRLTWSDETYRIFGMTAEGFGGTYDAFMACVHPDDRDKIVKAYEDSVANNQPYDVTHRIVRPDGTVRVVRERAEDVVAESGKTVVTVGIVHDVTEQVAAEEELRASERRFRRLFEDSPVALWEEDFTAVKAYFDKLRKRGVKDFRTYFDKHPQKLRTCAEKVKILNVNQAALDLHKANSKEELLSNLADTFTEKSFEVFKEEMVALAQGAVEFESEAEIKTLEGEPREVFLKFRVSSTGTGDGDYARSLLAMTDITERKRAEAALQESEEKYRSLFHDAPDMIHIVDTEGRVIDVNEAELKAMGYTREEYIGKSLSELVHPDFRDTTRAYFKKMLQGEEIRGYKTCMISKSGDPIDVEVTAAAQWRDGKIVAARAILRNVSQQVRLEKAVRNIEASLSFKFGEAFLQTLVIELARLLAADYFFVGKFQRDGCDSVQSLCFSVDGKQGENFTCALKDTPCENVAGKTLCVYPEHVCKQFPKDALLKQLKAEGYIGIPLYNSKQKVMGIMVALYRKRIADVQFAESIFNIFAGRTAAEIERAEREAALRGSEEKWRSITENSPDHIMLLDTEGEILFINRTVPDLRQEEVIGRSVFDFTPPEFHQVARECFERVVNSGEPDSYSTEYHAKDGQVNHFDVRIGPVFEGRDVVALVSSSTDVTKQRLAEEELRKLSSAVEQSGSVVMITNVNGDLEYVNSKFTEVSGYTAEEVRGRNPRFLKSGETPGETYKQLWETITSGGEWHGELHNRKKNGQLFWESASISAIKNSKGTITHFLAIKEDITAQKRSAAERERLIAELEAKNAELERFAYTVSHDLKSPLVTIKGFLGLLQEDVSAGDSKRVAADMEWIAKAADKMQDMLDELLQLSRIGRLVHPPEEISLAELANEAVSLVAGQIAASKARVDVCPDLPKVVGERPRLLEVYQNLIDNAVKFMGEQPNPHVEVGVRLDADEPVYFVRDNGEGIEPRYQKKVFGLFDRLNQQTKGSGIGLALVKRIIETHSGRIWIESEGGGKGTTVCFTIAKPNEESEDEKQNA